MRVQVDVSHLTKTLNNVVKYSEGFLDGIQQGKPLFLDSFAKLTVDALKEYIDSMARVNPQVLQHVYEWERSGSPEARLYDIEYFVTGQGISLNGTLTQSRSIQSGSNTPFYDKARIMEQGVPMRISPKSSDVLVFEQNGETVFTKNSVYVSNPGGEAAQGGFEKAFDSFINYYFSQSFLRSSGILYKLQDMSMYDANFSKGAKIGKGIGRQIGYRWIIKAGVID